MVSPNVNNILKATQALSDAECEELRRRLDERAATQPESTKQDLLRQALVERGLLEPSPPRGKDPERFRRWQPIPIAGKPLSETIIDERR
jgi:hypothetical protein